MSGLANPLDASTIGALLAELGTEARRFRFDVAPNPCVGAAVLSGSEVVARGYHRVWGGPHAEVDALERAAASDVPRDRWDCLVVTLEPCSSRGKTPPCVEAIVAAGLRTVVVGAHDPDPRHRGAGLEHLRDAGLEVLQLEQAAPLETTSSHFLRWTSHERLRRPRPWVIAKWAQTLTGQLSPPKGSKGPRISGPESRVEVAELRSHVDAIVTGIGTVLADDPRLTVRPANLAAVPPARVVLDTALRTPLDARLLSPPDGDEAGGAVHIVSMIGADAPRAEALRRAGAEVHGLRGDDRHSLNLREVSGWLWAQGFRRVLLEAGPTLAGAFLAAGFVDQLRVYTGSIPGGSGEGLGTTLAALRIEERIDRELGADQVLEGFIAAE